MQVGRKMDLWSVGVWAPGITNGRIIPILSCRCFAAVLGGQAAQVGRKMDLWSVGVWASGITNGRIIPILSCHCFAAVLGGQAVKVGHTSIHIFPTIDAAAGQFAKTNVDQYFGLTPAIG